MDLGFTDLLGNTPWIIVAWVVYHLLTKVIPNHDESLKELTRKLDALNKTIENQKTCNFKETRDE